MNYCNIYWFPAHCYSTFEGIFGESWKNNNCHSLIIHLSIKSQKIYVLLKHAYTIFDYIYTICLKAIKKLLSFEFWENPITLFLIICKCLWMFATSAGASTSNSIVFFSLIWWQRSEETPYFQCWNMAKSKVWHLYTYSCDHVDIKLLVGIAIGCVRTLYVSSINVECITWKHFTN